MASQPSLRTLSVALLVIASPSMSLAWQPNGDAMCSTATQLFHSIAPDGLGGVFVAYNLTESPLEVYLRHFSRAGISWEVASSCGERVFHGAEHSLTQSNGETRVAYDGEFGALVACANQRSGASQNIYAQRMDKYGLQLWGPIGVTVCSAAGDQQFSGQNYRSICSDAAGGAFVIWEDPRSGGSNVDVYMQHLDAFGNTAADTSNWVLNGLPVCTATGNQTQASIIPDGSGGVICVWQDARLSNNLDIYASRFNAVGELMPGWVAGGNLVCGIATDQSRPVLTTDGAGGAIIAWRDARHLSTETDVDIYAARILGDGTLDSDWTSGGAEVCLAAHVQSDPDIVSDGSGGAIIAWMDTRDGSTSGEDIYAQRTSSEGVMAWASDGVPVTTDTLDQATPRLTTDGAGGAFVCWDDKRNGDGNADIFAQRVTPAGEVAGGWSVDGDSVCTAQGIQSVPLIASGDAGIAFVAWTDLRPGQTFSPLIFYQRMTSDGEAGGTLGVSAKPSTGLDVAIAPNPAHSAARVMLTLGVAASVTVSVHDLSGRRVRTLVADQRQEAGHAMALWDLRSASGTAVAPGVYWIRVRAGVQEVKRSLIVLE